MLDGAEGSMAEQQFAKNADRGGKDTTDYSASKAPETAAEATEQVTTTDPRLIPGGGHGAHADVGMSAMDRADVPSGAEKPDQLSVGDAPKGVE
jgi:hypothetical protein